MTSFSSGVSEPDVVSVISLDDFPSMNLSGLFLNPSEDVQAVAGFRFSGS